MRARRGLRRRKAGRISGSVIRQDGVAAQCANRYCALVIAKSAIVVEFREEWPAVDGRPRQAAGDRIGSALSPLWLLRSVIAPAPSSDPDGCRNNWFASQGRVEEDDEG